MNEDVTEFLMNLLKERQAKGIETYGETLKTFNGRNAIWDEIEEMVDALQYRVQALMERKALEDELIEVKRQLVELRMERLNVYD